MAHVARRPRRVSGWRPGPGFQSPPAAARPQHGAAQESGPPKRLINSACWASLILANRTEGTAIEWPGGRLSSSSETAFACGHVELDAPRASSTTLADVGITGAAKTASTRTTLITVRKITAAASASVCTTFQGSLCSQ